MRVNLNLSARFKDLFQKVCDWAGKLNKKKRMLLMGGIVFVLAGGYFYLLYLPRSTDIHETRLSIEDLERKVAVAKAQARNLDKFKAEAEEINRQFEEALKLLPDSREIPSLLKAISQQGIDSRLEFLLFSPGQEQIRPFYVEIPVSIKVSGQYREVAAFFDKIRRMQRIVNVVNVEMKPKQDLSTDLETTCKAVTYRFKTEADEQIEKEQAAPKRGRR